MAKFKRGDRVRVVDPGHGWRPVTRKVTGTVVKEQKQPWVIFDNGETGCGPEKYLELAGEEKTMNEETEFKAGDVVINVSDYDTYLTVGKEYTLTNVSGAGSLYFLGDNGNERFRPSRHYKLKEAHITEAEKRGAKFGTLGVMKDTGERCVYIADSLVLPRFWEIDVEGKADRWHRHPSQIRLDHEPEFIAWPDAPDDLKFDASRIYYRDEPVKWIAKPEGTNLDFEWVAIVDNNGGPAFIVPKYLKVKV